MNGARAVAAGKARDGVLVDRMVQALWRSRSGSRRERPTPDMEPAFRRMAVDLLAACRVCGVLVQVSHDVQEARHG